MFITGIFPHSKSYLGLNGASIYKRSVKMSLNNHLHGKVDKINTAPRDLSR